MSNKAWKVFGTLVAVILLLALPGRWSGALQAGLREVLAPLHELLSGAGLRLREAGTTLRGFGGLIGENRRMSADLLRLQDELRRLEALREDNARLRAALGFQRASARRLLPAEVIARDASGWWQTLRLNRGLRDGVRAGTAVMTADGLAGRALDVSRHTTDVLLLSDPNCRVSVLLPRTGASGVLSGTGLRWNGQAVCRLELLHRHLPVRAGDEVFTSGLGGVFPAGLPVGYVEAVKTDEAGLTQAATVVPHADLGRMRMAFLVLQEPAP